ncbi:hypothetical protein HDU83_005443 [Entophlyctis luteolus]|nr:hypothetical protein HDU83_005443 [Entophlyctis luteolus]
MLKFRPSTLFAPPSRSETLSKDMHLSQGLSLLAVVAGAAAGAVKTKCKPSWPASKATRVASQVPAAVVTTIQAALNDVPAPAAQPEIDAGASASQVDDSSAVASSHGDTSTAVAEVDTQSAPNGDPCTDIFAIAAEYASAGNDPVAAVSFHNAVRAYVENYASVSLPAYTWSDALAQRAQLDAQYSVNVTAQSCGLSHSPDFGIADAKSLGYSTFTSAIRDFIEFNENGLGSECAQYFAAGIPNNVASHFAFIVSPTFSNVGCGTASCSSGQVIVGCDYN